MKYQVTVAQKSSSTHNEHSGWSHSLSGAFQVECELPMTCSVIQVGSSNGMGIRHRRSYRWMSGDPLEYGDAYLFSGRGYHDGSWSSWTTSSVFKPINLNSTQWTSYSQSGTGGYSSAHAWALGQVGWFMGDSSSHRTYSSVADLDQIKGYTNHTYGAFAFIYDTVDKKFVTGQEAKSNGQTIIGSTSSPLGGGDRYVLCMINVHPIVALDAVPPTISGPNYSASDVAVVGSTNYVKSNSITISYSASDSGGSGLAGIWIDGSQASTSGSASKTYTGPAPFTTTAYAKDGAGNVSGTVSKSFQFDTVAPTISGPNYSASDIVTVGSEKYVVASSITLTYTATDAESGVASIWIDGVQAGTSSSASKTYTGPAPFSTEAYAIDVAGNQSTTTSSESFKFDITPPTVAIQALTPKVIGGKDYYNGSVDIQIDTDDTESGLDTGDLIINGTTTPFTTTTGQTTYTKTLDTADGIIEGVNSVEYVSKDKVGNEDSDAIIFYVDKTKPDGYIVFSAGNKIRSRGGTLYTKETNVDVDLHFGDAGADPSGVTKGLIQINNNATPSVGSFASGISLSSSPKTSHNVTGLVSGQVNTLTFFVIDAVDNISVGDTISVTVEQVNPSGLIDVSSAETPKITKTTTNYINDGVVELKVTHSDSESNLF